MVDTCCFAVSLCCSTDPVYIIVSEGACWVCGATEIGVFGLGRVAIRQLRGRDGEAASYSSWPKNRRVSAPETIKEKNNNVWSHLEVPTTVGPGYWRNQDDHQRCSSPKRW